MEISNDNKKLIPQKSASYHELIVDFDDIKFSCCEYNEGPVGMTLIIFPKSGARVNVDIRGGWPGYINTSSRNNGQVIDGICVSGGSLLGLECVSGVMVEWLKSTNYNYFPAINGAIIYSQNLYNNKIYPDKELGMFAFNNLSKNICSGQVGAGLSASKGQGVHFEQLDDGIKVFALVVNNAVGSVYHNDIMVSEANLFSDNLNGNKNTTIITIITNITLDRNELEQLSHQVNAFMGKIIRPFNTFADGDIIYTCSTCSKNKPTDFTNFSLINLYIKICSVVEEAVYNSLKK